MLGVGCRHFEVLALPAEPVDIDDRFFDVRALEGVELLVVGLKFHEVLHLVAVLWPFLAVFEDDDPSCLVAERDVFPLVIKF